MECAGEGILIARTGDRTFCFANDAICQLLGYSREELLKLGVGDIHPPEEVARVVAEFEAQARGERVLAAELPVLRKNGEVLLVDIRSRPIRVGDEEFMIGMFADVTERVEARAALAESEARYAGLFEHMLSACCLCRLERGREGASDFRVVSANDALARYLGSPRSEIEGRSGLAVLPDIAADDRRWLELFAHAVDKHRPLQIESPSADRERWLEYSIFGTSDDEFVIAFADITERKAGEQRLIGSKEELERIVKERTEELREANEELHEASRAKSDFLARMSHELRTPLNSIIGFTGVLQSELAGPLTEEQRKQLKMVRASSDHLLELVNDVLDLAKIEAGRLEIHAQKTRLDEALTQPVEMLTAIAKGKGLDLTLEVDKPSQVVFVDRRTLNQILMNLLSNAVKFTVSGSVSVTTEVLETEVEISIADTGIGIAPDRLRSVFEEFTTSPVRRDIAEGTGLGLAIVSRLVAALGGSVTVASELGEGSTFSFTIPINGTDRVSSSEDAGRT